MTNTDLLESVEALLDGAFNGCLIFPGDGPVEIEFANDQDGGRGDRPKGDPK